MRLRRGLTDTVASTVPLKRVQAISVQQPFVWRPFNWWRVKVNVAGAKIFESGDQGMLLPVGTLEEALAVVATVDPNVDPHLLVRGLTQPRQADGFEGTPTRARWVDPVAFRRRGVAVTPSSLLIRAGFLGRRVDLVPHARIQSLTLDQGPIQRTLGLASVQPISTMGPVHPNIQHLSLERAQAVFNDERGRASAARVQS